MEKRILTDRFAMRFATTMHGILFTDAFFALRYFNNATTDFKEEMGKLAYQLMHNPEVEASGPQAASTPSPRNGKKQARRVLTNSGCVSTSSSDGQAHPLVKMKALPSWVGGKDGRQRCIVCDKKTLWCCLDCSDAPLALVPLCPMSSNKRGVITTHACYEKHCADPSWMPKGRRPTGGSTKRCRASYDDFSVELEDGCNECESDEFDEEAEGEE